MHSRALLIGTATLLKFPAKDCLRFLHFLLLLLLELTAAFPVVTGNDHQLLLFGLSTLQLSQAALSSLKACSKPRGNRRKNCEAGGFSSLTPYLFLMTHPTFIGSFCLSPSFCLSSHQRLLSGLRWHLPFSRSDPCFPALLPRRLSNSSPTENASSFISSLS